MPEQTERELLTEIRDLLRPVAEVYRPQFEELMRTRKRVQIQQIMEIAGRGRKRTNAAKLMDGTRTRKQIATESGIDSGDLSRVLTALKGGGLVDEVDARPRLVVEPTIVWSN